MLEFSIFVLIICIVSLALCHLCLFLQRTDRQAVERIVSMSKTHHPMPWHSVALHGKSFNGLAGASLQQRMLLNRNYMLSLKTANLLQNHYQEAGLWGPSQQPEDCHWGWESPT